ncbi:putative virion structural protein [Erwinia phage vB_EamM_MadMel]|uniref:Putative virion structural protein n=3 Tax=Agricanvirus TaxID=1984776 RepID=A0A191ZBR2_9CAUD|nr:virion structural protein [Erwinia phage vB_EamM_Special G]ANJ64827.2 putative virion structural protein [Erwinia phage vB_EamM_Special G]AUG85805.1 putative virion structural protein [Erwinia phage vB_EamM_Bosolaphorus]AUG86445.1 putative virion structural protein [Erwinia phage vB_EamM_MadMel]
MAQQISVNDVVYPFNPLNTVAGAKGIVESHTLTPANGVNYVTFVPRAAPFFRRTLVLKNKANNQVLVEGQHYTLAYFFAPFTQLVYKGVYGGITVNELDAPIEVEVTYDTIGGDFVLDSTGYAQLAANLVNNPRELDWTQIADTPDTYPPIDHTHPADQTLNYMDYVEQLQAMQALVASAIGGYVASLNTHIDTQGNAHGMKPIDIGLGNVMNWAPATTEDIPGGGTTLYASLAIVKQAFQYMYGGLTTPALKSAILNDYLSAESVVRTLTVLNEGALLNTDEVANFGLWKTYRAQMLIKASTGNTTVLTPPAVNGAFSRLLGV